MIKLETRHKVIIEKILSEYPYHFYAYGSRVKGENRKLSDLDLCYQENVPSDIAEEIREKFAESNLPFMVELVNWKHMRPSFQQAIKKDLVLISASNKATSPL